MRCEQEDLAVHIWVGSNWNGQIVVRDAPPDDPSDYPYTFVEYIRESSVEECAHCEHARRKASK